jgi:two-component system response regulator YesN
MIFSQVTANWGGMEMYKVILVDDEIYVRKGLKSLIDWKSCGFEVIEEAGDGEQALSLIRKVKPDLVVTDIRMPVLDGLELIKKVVKDEGNQTKFIILSGYSDFTYAQTAVRYGVHDFILKSIDKDEMEDTLKLLAKSLFEEKIIRKKNEELKRKVIMDNLLIGKADEDETVTYLESLSLGNPKGFYYMILEVNEMDRNPNETVDMYLKLKKKLSVVIQDVCDLKENVIIQDLEQGTFGVLITTNYLTRFHMNIHKFVHWIRGELSKRIPNEATFYVGQEISELSLLKMSYQTAQKALQYKYVHGEKNIIFFDDIACQTLNYTVLDDAFFHMLIEKMDEESTEIIIDAIEKIFQQFYFKTMAKASVLASINHLVHAILKVIRKMDGDLSQLTTLHTMLQVSDNQLTLAQLKKLVIDFVLESRVIMLELRRNSAMGDVYKIKQYIDSHYHEKISLKTIAAKFFMNPVYLGQLFKKSYGVYFKDYLLQVRINEAKKLLRQSEMRIYKIAEIVGFNNTDYFVTIFGKLEKITPSEYRNKLLENRKM